jgi:hypothetical protein
VLYLLLLRRFWLSYRLPEIECVKETCVFLVMKQSMVLLFGHSGLWCESGHSSRGTPRRANHGSILLDYPDPLGRYDLCDGLWNLNILSRSRPRVICGGFWPADYLRDEGGWLLLIDVDGFSEGNLWTTLLSTVT